MIARLFAKFFWDVYDFLGRLILANVILFFLMTGLAAVASLVMYPLWDGVSRKMFVLAAAGLFLIFAVPMPAAGLLSFLADISDDSEPAFRDIFAGLRRHYARLASLTAVFVLAFEVLAANFLFYMTSGAVPPALKIPAAVAAGLCLWAGIFLCAMMLYAYPLAVHQGVGLKKILKRSALLVLDNLGATVYAIVMAAGILGLGLLTRGVTIFLFNLVLWASLSNSLYVNVMEKYELREAQKAATGEREGPRPASWKQLKHEEFIEDRHKRYKRTLREILKPWEY